MAALSDSFTIDQTKEKHLKLAGIVKSVHAKLRRKFKQTGDYDGVWREHCKDECLLLQYADAMHHLATQIWTKHEHTRIHWCRDVCIEYYLQEGIHKALVKDRRKKLYETVAACDNDGTGRITDIPSMQDCRLSHSTTIMFPLSGCIRLLDVGSCYNAFQEYTEFQALGIDISPAVQSVHLCDFLHLEMTEPAENLTADDFKQYLNNLPSSITTLPSDMFHVVVFSLLLEYLPSPCQRWLCCQNASKLLTLHGILIIITPDSHHQNRNAAMIKSWRTALESMGFCRWRYVKLEHLHCMVFRKVSTDLYVNTEITPDMLYIPQDFHDVEEATVCSIHKLTEADRTELMINFDELPNFDDF